MKKIIYSSLILAGVLLIFNSCNSSGKQQGLVYFNDFESAQGWLPGLLFCNFPVHSGIMACKIDSSHPYGPTLRMKFDDISPRQIKKVKYSIWCYMKTKNTQGKLFVSVDGGGKQNILYEAKDMRDVVKEIGKWVELKGECSLNRNGFNNPANTINIYPWNTSKEEVVVDDMQVTFVP